MNATTLITISARGVNLRACVLIKTLVAQSAEIILAWMMITALDATGLRAAGTAIVLANALITMKQPLVALRTAQQTTLQMIAKNVQLKRAPTTSTWTSMICAQSVLRSHPGVKLTAQAGVAHGVQLQQLAKTLKPHAKSATNLQMTFVSREHFRADGAMNQKSVCPQKNRATPTVINTQTVILAVPTKIVPGVTQLRNAAIVPGYLTATLARHAITQTVTRTLTPAASWTRQESAFTKTIRQATATPLQSLPNATISAGASGAQACGHACQRGPPASNAMNGP